MSKAKIKIGLTNLSSQKDLRLFFFHFINEVEINGIFSQHFVNLQFNIRYIYLLY